MTLNQQKYEEPEPWSVMPVIVSTVSLSEPKPPTDSKFQTSKLNISSDLPRCPKYDNNRMRNPTIENFTYKPIQISPDLPQCPKDNYNRVQNPTTENFTYKPIQDIPTIELDDDDDEVTLVAEYSSNIKLSKTIDKKRKIEQNKSVNKQKKINFPIDSLQKITVSQLNQSKDTSTSIKSSPTINVKKKMEKNRPPKKQDKIKLSRDLAEKIVSQLNSPKAALFSIKSPTIINEKYKTEKNKVPNGQEKKNELSESAGKKNPRFNTTKITPSNIKSSTMIDNKKNKTEISNSLNVQEKMKLSRDSLEKVILNSNSTNVTPSTNKLSAIIDNENKIKKNMVPHKQEKIKLSRSSAENKFPGLNLSKVTVTLDTDINKDCSYLFSESSKKENTKVKVHKCTIDNNNSISQTYTQMESPVAEADSSTEDITFVAEYSKDQPPPMNVNQVAPDTSSKLDFAKPLDKCKSPKESNVNNESICRKESLKIKLLKIEMAMYNKRIKELEEKEVGEDDDDEETSPYIMADKLKQKVMHCYRTICKLKGKKEITHNKKMKNLLSNLELNEERLPKLTEAIKTLACSKRYWFPDYTEIFNCVKHCLEKTGKKTELSEIHYEARDVFTKVGNILQKGRKLDEFQSMCSYISDTVDPADIDSGLAETLNKNYNIGKRNEERIFDKFARDELISNIGLQKSQKNDPSKKTISMNGVKDSHQGSPSFAFKRAKLTTLDDKENKHQTKEIECEDSDVEFISNGEHDTVFHKTDNIEEDNILGL